MKKWNIIAFGVSCWELYRKFMKLCNHLAFKNLKYSNKKSGVCLNIPHLILGQILPSHLSCPNDTQYISGLYFTGGMSPVTHLCSQTGLPHLVQNSCKSFKPLQRRNVIDDSFDRLRNPRKSYKKRKLPLTLNPTGSWYHPVSILPGFGWYRSKPLWVVVTSKVLMWSWWSPISMRGSNAFFLGSPRISTNSTFLGRFFSMQNRWHSPSLPVQPYF